MSTPSLTNQSVRHKSDPSAPMGVFEPPYDRWSAEQVLQYFQQRQTVQYFPVIDPLETDPGKMERIVSHDFVFHHESHHLGTPINWLMNPSQDREWMFMLHKFYYGVGLGTRYQETQDNRYAHTWVELTESWIDQVSLDFLPSRVAGRRIQNWIFSHFFFIHPNSRFSPPPQFYLKFLRSLFQQVQYLAEHLDKARNHRTLELCAIFWTAVVFPEFRHAEQWLQFSTEALAQNIQEDLLPDGVHCELSTEYHHLVLKNYLGVLRLATLNQISLPDIIASQIYKALEFSLYVHKPDGFIPALSDADPGCYRDLLRQGYELFGSKTFLYGASQGTQGIPPTSYSKGFSDSGYFVMRSGWGDQQESFENERYLVADCGPLGQGNHGHLDALNVEVAAYGRSLIVDPGRYTYDESGKTNWRAAFRGTAAHNTVLIDGKNQTSYRLGASRFEICGPEPVTEVVTFETQPGFDYLHAVVRSAEYPVIHERKILFLRPDYWVIADILRAEEPHRYDLLFHLSSEAHHRCHTILKQNTLIVQSPNLLLAQLYQPKQFLSLSDGFVSSSYGTKHAAPVITFSQQESIACFHTVVFPFLSTTPTLSLQPIPVTGQNGPCKDISAFGMRISYQSSSSPRQDYVAFRHLGVDPSYRVHDWELTQKLHLIRTMDEGTIVEQHTL